jgi:hypothetical protein
MLTVVESPLFSKLWRDYWTEDELGEFCAFIATRPNVGDVVPGSGGCRKVRWSRSAFSCAVAACASSTPPA